MNRLNLLLTIALAFVSICVALLRVDPSRPNYQIRLGNDMASSPAYTAFEPNPDFANGRTLQDPVSGTIARGFKPFRFAATPEDALRAGEQLVNPWKELSEDEARSAAERGSAIFQIYCAACHGADGAGNGPVAKRGFPPPPSLLTGKSLDMKDGQLFHILTHGQNSMPQFAAQLTPDRRWDVILFVRQLQQQSKPPAEQADSTSKSKATVEPPKAAAEAPSDQEPPPDSAATTDQETEPQP